MANVAVEVVGDGGSSGGGWRICHNHWLWNEIYTQGFSLMILELAADSILGGIK